MTTTFHLIGFGVAPTAPNQTPKELPVAWADPVPFRGHNLVYVASNLTRVAAVTDKGGLFLWGDYYDPESPSDTNATKRITRPTLFPFLGDVRVAQVAIGEAHTLALSDSGSVFSWGCGFHGQLGHGNVHDLNQPRMVESLVGKSVVQIACGKNHSMARTQNGDAFSWGFGRDGQLGHETEIFEFTPKFIKKLLGKKIVCIAAGYNHSIAISEDGIAFSWGDNSSGQLGLGSRKCTRSPTSIGAFTDIVIRQASAGFQFSMFLDSHGRVFTCGLNNNGQLGTGDRIPYDTPQVCKSLMEANITKVYCGYCSAAAITDTNLVYTWGNGKNNRLGHGHGKDTLTPALVNLLRYDRVSSVCMGGNYTYALIELPSF